MPAHKTKLSAFMLRSTSIAMVPLLPLLLGVSDAAFAQSVDYAQIPPPRYQPIATPAVPQFVCTESEKRALAQALAQQGSKAVGNVGEADRYLAALNNAASAYRTRGQAVPVQLAQLLRAAEAAVAERNRQSAQAHARFQRASALPVTACRPLPDEASGAIRPITAAIDAAAVARADRSGSAVERRKVIEDVIRALAPYEAGSADARQLATTLRLLLDRERIRQRSKLSEIIGTLSGTPGRPPLRSMQALGADVLDRARHFTQMLATGQYSSEDAARLLSVAKYAAQLRDDIRQPGGSLTGENGTKATELLTTAAGVTAIIDGSMRGDGRVAVDGLRDVIARSRPLATSVGVVLDLPAEVVASVLNVSRNGMILSAEALEDIPAAQNGDPAALRRLIARSRELESTLSGQSYGNAMKDALQSRLVDRVPGLRATLNWFPNDGLPPVATTPVATGPKARDVGFRWYWSAMHSSVNENDIIVCGPDPYRSTGGVEGTDEYSRYSLLCVAAVHAGAIGWEGGRFRVRFIAAGGAPLVASLRHGIQSGSSDPFRRPRFSVEPVDLAK